MESKYIWQINVNSKEYFEQLFDDPRPWWNELPPPKRNSKIKLTSISRLRKLTNNKGKIKI